MSNTTVPTETKSAYVASPIDACEEAAHRINVVLRLLSEHDGKEDDDSPESRHGYDLSMMRDALESIRDSLLASVTQALAESEVK